MNNISLNNSQPSKSDQFELLSAYIDGEVSASERQQVEQWLSQDLALQQSFQQLLKLQSGFKTLPVAAPAVQTEKLVNSVLARADQTNRLRLLGGVGAAAALVVGSIFGLLMGQNWTQQTAQRPDSVQPIQARKEPTLAATRNDPSTLMIALERPPVKIPVVHGSDGSRRSATGSTVEF